MAMLRIRHEGGRCYSREHCPVLDSALPGENLPWWWFRFKEPPHHNDLGVRRKPTAVTPATATDTDESSVFTVTWELGHVNTHGCPTHLTTRRQLTLRRGGFHR